MTKLDFIDKPINPDTPRLFTVISTFAGCGGSSLGYKWAGGKVLAAVEWEQNAVDTYRLNHKGTHVLHRDIATVTAQELFDLCGIKAGELDILDGSPPCQGFSTAGNREINDPRNNLFREYVRLLRDIQPRTFIMENVSGMIKGKMKLFFAECLRELKTSGYNVSVRLMNVMYFGVPQSRERMIFIGVREDLSFKATHPAAQSKLFKVSDAFINIKEASDAPQLSPLYRKYWHEAGQGGSVGKLNSVRRLALYSPSCTLVKSEGNGAPYHPTECRAISTAERKRLSSFPDAFVFTGRASATERIGNSVPPKFMQAIAEHIYTTILSKVMAPTAALEVEK